MKKNIGPWVWRRATVAGRNAAQEIDTQNNGRIPNLFWQFQADRAKQDFYPHARIYLRGVRHAFWGN